MIVLRLPKGARLGWLLLTSLAWLLTAGVVILVLASAVDRNIDIYGLQPAVIAIAGGVWIGTVFGVCQWRTLRHLFTGAGWWIIASILGWIAFFELMIHLSSLPLPYDVFADRPSGGGSNGDDHRHCTG